MKKRIQLKVLSANYALKPVEKSEILLYYDQDEPKIENEILMINLYTLLLKTEVFLYFEILQMNSEQSCFACIFPSEVEKSWILVDLVSLILRFIHGKISILCFKLSYFKSAQY